MATAGAPVRRTPDGFDLFETRGWTIRARKTRISTTAEIEALEAAHENLRSLPEMVFGLNEVELVHAESKLRLRFSTSDAFAKIPTTADGHWGLENDWVQSEPLSPELAEAFKAASAVPATKSAEDDAGEAASTEPGQAAASSPELLHLRPRLAHSDTWKSGQSAQVDASAVYSYDWTFCSRFVGSVDRADGSSDVRIERAIEPLDIERLKRPDPILFFHETVFFEDELADSGTSQLSLKMRVMPTCFFVLLQFFLRIDGVLFRAAEARYFHVFGSNYVLRHVGLREGDAVSIEQRFRRRREKQGRSGTSGVPATGRHQKTHVEAHEIIPLIPPKLEYIERIHL